MLKYHHDLDLSTQNSHSLILNKITPGSRVLELGPATGYMTKYMNEHLGCSVTCVELDAQSAKLAEPYSTRMIVANLDDLVWYEQLKGESFSHVIFADVLEHLLDPLKVLMSATSLLEKDGTVLASVPNIGHNAIIMDLLQGKFEYRKVGLLDDTHVRFFTRDSLFQLLEDAGLNPLELQGTFAAPEETEFAQSYASLPKEFRELLMRKKDGHVYQFIVTAKRKVEGPIEETIFGIDQDQEKHQSVFKAIQVFWPQEWNYSEQNSKTIPVQEENSEYTFEVPGLEQGVLRLDPVNLPGIVAIQEMEIHGISGSNITSLNYSLEYGRTTSVLPSEEGLLLLCLDEDSQIYIDVPDRVSYNSLEFHLKLSFSEEPLHSVLGIIRKLEHNSDLLKDEFDRKVQEMHDVEKMLTQTTEVLQNTTNELHQTTNELHQTTKELHYTSQELNKREQVISEMVNSSSWRWTRALRFAGRIMRNPKHYLKDLSYMATRRKFRPELIPMQEITALNLDQLYSWESTGQDPQFSVKGPWPTGWVQINWALETENNHTAPSTLYLNQAGYYSERSSVFLGSSRQHNKLYARIDPSTVGLRVDPLEASGKFRILDFSIRRVSGLEIKLRSTVGKSMRKTKKLLKFGKYSYAKYKDWKIKRGRNPQLGELLPLMRKAYYDWRNRQQALAGNMDPPIGFHLPEPLDPYDAWLEVNRWNERRQVLLQDRLQALTDRPLLSIIMPVYNPPIVFFEKALESVLNQQYEHWELCIADDASTDPEVKRIIHKWMAQDSRIRAVFCESNGHISRATNVAAELASGDFIVLMDNDDELTPDALGEVALYAALHPQADVIYSDDDKIDTAGRRFAPQFKPDWSPELLLSFMYFSHLFVIRTSLYRQVGGMRTGFEGSQDYDLALRVTEHARHVGHIPKILYHWRVLPGSTASSGSAKPESFEAGRTAVQEAFDRRGISGRAELPDWALKAGCGIYYHVFSDQGPKVAVIIPTKNQYKILKSCIDSIAKTSYQNYEIIIVDNESDDPDTRDYLNRSNHKVLRLSNPNGKFNYAYLNNEAVKSTDADYVLFLNNDTEVVSPRWLSQMVGYLQIAGVGAVGARLLFPDGRIQHAGITHGLYNGMAGPSFKLLPSWNNGYLSLAAVTRNSLAVTAACLLTSKQIFESVGGFDEKQFAVAYNDVDFCYRLFNAGYRSVYCPSAELKHYEGYSRGFADNPAEGAAFRKKYRSLIDPYYNPNLSLDNERFEIRSKTVSDSDFPPVRTLMCAFNLNWEGAPYSQYELTVKLKEEGVIEPIVYCPSDGPLKKAYEDKGIPVFIFDHPLLGVFSIKEYDTAIRKFADQLQEWNVELVYGNTLQTFYAVAAAKVLDLPSIWNPRESEPWQTYFDHFGPEIAAKALECYNYPYKIVYVADATRNGVLPLDVHLNFTTVHNGLDRGRLLKALEEWPQTKARTHLQIGDSETAVLLLGTVSERKGQLDLVEAVSNLDRELVQQAQFFIVGDRPSEYSRRLHERLQQLEPSVRARVHLVPETSDTALYLSSADIFVCTSRVESFPRVILEAMAVGLPIITTPAFGIVEQVQQNVNGFFYEPGDFHALSLHLDELINNEELRERMSGNSHYVLDLINDYESMSQAYGQIFREAWISGRSR